MRIGKQDRPFTAISTSTAATITVRGEDLCRDLIGQIGFTDYFFLLLTGGRPSPLQRLFLDAVLVAIAEHGLVPSVQASRMTLAAAPEAWQGAVAAGLLGCGSVVLGSSEAAGQFLAEALRAQSEKGLSEAQAALLVVREARAARKAVPGIGHPQHSQGDPRADRLLGLADGNNAAGAHVSMLRAVSQAAREVYGKPLPINVSGAIPAVMLDVGFPLGALKGIPLLARTAGLIAHLLEESQRSIGFIMSHHAAEAIAYDGVAAVPDESPVLQRKGA